MDNAYRQQKGIELKKNTEQVLKDLPSYVYDFYVAKSVKLSPYTLSNYIIKINLFFSYLVFCDSSPYCGRLKKDISLSDISSLNGVHIANFFLWLGEEHKINKDGEHLPPVSKNTMVNYYNSLNAFFNRLVKEKKITQNPMSTIDSPKEIKSDKISYLDHDEREKFLNSVEYGYGLSDRAMKFHVKNKERDIALYYLILSTGCRVTEIVGLDVSDVNFKENSIRVFRKGDKSQYLYFSDLARQYLIEYLAVRENIYKPKDNENALFLSKSGERLGVRSIQIAVKNYVQASNPQKNEKITPHKLRSTFAMNSYAKNHDLELVRDQLGHSSTAVTNRYAKATDEMRKDVRNDSDY